MSTYSITETPHLTAIAECQYAVGDKLKFTKFTSCLGLFCKIKGSTKLVGIHLVLFDENDVPFTEADVAKVKTILEKCDAEWNTGWLVGCLDYWTPEIIDLFLKIFEDPKQERVKNCDSGFYSAEVINQAVMVTFEA